LQRALVEDMSEKDISKKIKQLEKQMLEHARNLEFEKAARVRDQLALLKEQAFGASAHDNVVPIDSAKKKSRAGTPSSWSAPATSAAAPRPKSCCARRWSRPAWVSACTSH